MLSLYIILTVIKGIHYGITEVFNEKILKKLLFIDKMLNVAVRVYMLCYGTCDYVQKECLYAVCCSC